jgi:DEAD/DEAH box helicase domain-containing protein
VRVVLTKPLAPGVKHGVIELYRTITGYYKGDYNQPTETWETYEGSGEEDWINFTWTSTHMAYKIELPSQFIVNNLKEKEDPGIHTITHVFANAAKIVTKCEAIDIEAHYDSGSIYLYDNTNDGVNGFTQMIYEKQDKILETSKELLNNCECDKGEKPELGGCPKCTFTTGFCSTNNQQLDKKKAREFFGVL